MSDRLFTALSSVHLASMGAALESGRWGPPYTEIPPFLPSGVLNEVRGDLMRLGRDPRDAALVLRALAAERRALEEAATRVEVVCSGPDPEVPFTRDTGAVLRDLFRSAQRTVTLSTFVLDPASKNLLSPLCDRMAANPDLRVRIFVDVKRSWSGGHMDPRPTALVLGEFCREFQSSIWPRGRIPGVFYDPRSLDLDTHARASLHAKFVVVDDARVFLTSANFTEAARERNVEAGVLVEDRNVAQSLREHFDALVEAGVLVRIMGEMG